MAVNVKCPNCGYEDKDSNFNTVIGKTIVQDDMTIVDVGYGCPKCGHKFGFELP